MAVEAEAADTGGADSFEQEMEAARVAQSGEGAEGEAAPLDPEAEASAAAAAAKPPLAPEEVQRRLEDQKKATRAERVKRQELETTLRQVQERLTQFEQGGGPAKAAEGLGERPNPSEDPIGYLEYVEAMVAAGAEQEAQARQQQEARDRAAQETQAVVSRVAEYENDFRDLNPDYDAAVEHLYAAKKAEYTDTGYTDEEAHSMVMAEFLTRSKRAFTAGKDPAEIVYSLAKRAGYTGAEKAKAADGDQRLAAIERGQRAASPLSATGGGGNGELTVESVSKLNGAAFDSAFAKLRERARQVERATGL